jgi:hypothetical protein
MKLHIFIPFLCLKLCQSRAVASCVAPSAAATLRRRPPAITRLPLNASDAFPSIHHPFFDWALTHNCAPETTQMVIRDAKVKPVPPLHIACRDRDIDAVLRLISLDDSGAVREGSANVNEKDDGSGWTPLHVIAAHRSIATRRHPPPPPLSPSLSLSRSSPVYPATLKSSASLTASQLLALLPSFTSLLQVRHLLGSNANVRVTDNPYYQTPLHIASKYGHSAICRMLVQPPPHAIHRTPRATMQ